MSCCFCYNTLELLAVFNPAQTMSFRLHVEKELGEPSERARAEARSRADALRRSRTAAGVGLKTQTSGVGVHESAPGPGVHRIFFPRRCGSRAAHTQQATREPCETTERRAASGVLSRHVSPREQLSAPVAPPPGRIVYRVLG